MTTNTLLIKQAVSLLEAARHQAVKQTNSLMVLTYFYLGYLIVEHEQKGQPKATYGASTIKHLSKALCKKFGNGFSERNLEQIRAFFLIYKNRQKQVTIPQTVSAEFATQHKIQLKKPTDKAFPLSWSHYVLLCRIKEKNERSFYEIEATHNNWGVRELQRQINSSLFERLVLSKDKKRIQELARKGQIVEKPEDILKTPYILEFLGLEGKSNYTASDLEKAIIDKIEHFLLEMGKGFLFQGRQVRFSFDEESFFCRSGSIQSSPTMLCIN
ncbi:Predicted nuclease of restriction endonuclease-like (RecB) superfamily, DUF1016 family [Chitinophaga eiseniae]|uniref:Predicted nuclease of restriction endonuclease-like (RecB) superfamily, DUF1016 family n=1 Tax=Chitinophaga eiseniae TaxID=634771 RepID=A0A1T4PX36_9BACT|nr:PDDEXK nuclease domain-containing protein [Chitinophaga eiseniae]SJZ96082.1 Predicted nuclease of restriction endonuclease-like (RecB) superfamily, DUF1016 family [Chitinophaga eiseniae]